MWGACRNFCNKIHHAGSDLGLYCLHMSHKKDVRLKWVKGFRWLRVYRDEGTFTVKIPMFEIILHHEVIH